jgi:hypothetical protein
MWCMMVAQGVLSSCREDRIYVALSANIDLLKWNGTPLVVAGAGCLSSWRRLESRWVQNSGLGSAHCFLKD